MPVVLAASLISVVRLGLFWSGRTLMGTYSDWRQIAGYLVLMIARS